jgi:hypothetical protein
MRPRPAMESGTIQGASIALLASFVAAITPPAAAIAARQHPAQAENYRDIASIVLTICSFLGGVGSVGAINSRLGQGDLWTPRGIPGPDRQRVLENGEGQRRD